MKKIILLMTFGLATLFTQAQGYDTAFGLRLGTEWGLTLKQRLAQRITAEGILQYSNRYKQTTITALGAQHFPLLVRNFNIYGGAGLHKGFVNIDGDDAPKDPFGLTFIGGAEISVGRINVSWDIKPSINVTGGEKTIYTHTGVSVRYIIDKRPLIEKKSEKEKARAQRQRQKRKDKRKKKRAKNREKGKGVNWKIWEKS
ncbi:MAG: hypothetical protein AAF806_11820 [Bacteroidota bacterium]